MPSNPDLRRGALALLLVGWAAAVALITLTRAGVDSSFQNSVFCVACGARGLADLISNWILFVPLGMLAAWRWSGLAAVAVSLAVTLGIEGLQHILPGRVPSVQDILMNTLGGATGAWIVLRATTPAPFRALAGIAAFAWLSAPLLLLPSSSSGEIYGQWTSRIGGFERYGGEVLSADLGGIPLPSARLRNEERVRDELSRRAPVTIRFIAGPRSRALAPIVSVVDWHERPIFLLGTIGDDLVLRTRNVARLIRLDQPDVRWPGALGGVNAGDTVTVKVETGRGSLCIGVGQTTRCRLAPGPGDGWAFLLNLEGGPTGLRTAMAVGWSLGIGFLLGLPQRSLSRAAGTGLLVAILGLVAGVVSPDLRPDAVHALALLGGVAMGALSRGTLLRVFSRLAGDRA
jgi:hypothetical protein